MILDAIDADRLERAVADVQRDRGDSTPRARERGEQRSA